MIKMNIDKYNEVINGDITYKTIAETLLDTGKCIIGWTDQKYDHRDILFTYRPNWLGGNLQRGLRWCYLYVSIMGCYSMGFLIEADVDNRKFNSYIMEKLRLNDNDCDNKICDLINGVIHEMDKMEGRVENE